MVTEPLFLLPQPAKAVTNSAAVNNTANIFFILNLPFKFFLYEVLRMNCKFHIRKSVHRVAAALFARDINPYPYFVFITVFSSFLFR